MFFVHCLRICESAVHAQENNKAGSWASRKPTSVSAPEACKLGLPVPCRRGVLIEAGPNNFARLVQNRPNALCVNLPICNSRRHVSLVEQWGEGDLPLCHAHDDCHRATQASHSQALPKGYRPAGSPPHGHARSICPFNSEPRGIKSSLSPAIYFNS